MKLIRHTCDISTCTMSREVGRSGLQFLLLLLEPDKCAASDGQREKRTVMGYSSGRLLEHAIVARDHCSVRFNNHACISSRLVSIPRELMNRQCPCQVFIGVPNLTTGASDVCASRLDGAPPEAKNDNLRARNERSDKRHNQSRTLPLSLAFGFGWRLVTM